MKKKIFKSVLILALISYLGICGFFYFRQEAIIFHPKKIGIEQEYLFPENFEEQFIQTDSVNFVHALLFNADSSKGLVIYFHGNAGALDTWGANAKFFTDLGYSVLMPDYRGYGKSSGEIGTEADFYKDMLQVYDFGNSMFPEENIILTGNSLGTAMATNIAAQKNPGALILLAPFLSMDHLRNHHYPFLPGFLLKYKFPNVDFIKDKKCPLLLIHGTNDEVVPVDHSRTLSQHLKPGDKFIEIKGAEHNGLQNLAEVKKGIEAWLNPGQ